MTRKELIALRDECNSHQSCYSCRYDGPCCSWQNTFDMEPWALKDADIKLLSAKNTNAEEDNEQ